MKKKQHSLLRGYEKPFRQLRRLFIVVTHCSSRLIVGSLFYFLKLLESTLPIFWWVKSIIKNLNTNYKASRSLFHFNQTTVNLLSTQNSLKFERMIRPNEIYEKLSRSKQSHIHKHWKHVVHHFFFRFSTSHYCKITTNLQRIKEATKKCENTEETTRQKKKQPGS